jgi:hypothetical protein
MRNGGKLVRASDALAMIPIEKIAVAQETAVAKEIVEAPRPAAQISVSAPARVAWTSSNIVMTTLEPKHETQPSEPLAPVVRTTIKTAQLPEGSTVKAATFTPTPRPPKLAPSKAGKPPGPTLH